VWVRFENVDMPPGRAFIASAEYKDIAYKPMSPWSKKA
jgi:hypothetical protein